MHNRLVIPILSLALVTGVAIAAAQTEMPSMDTLARLKNAMQNAGASALTSAQESSLTKLMADFRSAHQPSPNSTIQAARTAYENAILSGDSVAAASQAAIIGNTQAAELSRRESDVAVFAIGAVNVLKTQCGQLEALITKMGSAGTVRLLLGLVGGSGFGPGPGGPGRGGLGPGRPGPQGMRRGLPPEF